MRLRLWLIGVLLLYALLDLGSAMSPPSFQLQPGESTEELWAGRRPSAPVVVRASWRPVGVAAERPLRQIAGHQPRQVSAVIGLPVGRARVPASAEPASPDDDH